MKWRVQSTIITYHHQQCTDLNVATWTNSRAMRIVLDGIAQHVDINHEGSEYSTIQPIKNRDQLVVDYGETYRREAGMQWEMRHGSTYGCWHVSLSIIHSSFLLFFQSLHKLIRFFLCHHSFIFQLTFLIHLNFF